MWLLIFDPCSSLTMARLTEAAAVAVVREVADEPNQLVNHGRFKFVHEYLQQREISWYCFAGHERRCVRTWRDKKPAPAPYLSAVNVRTLLRQSCCRTGVLLHIEHYCTLMYWNLWFCYAPHCLVLGAVATASLPLLWCMKKKFVHLDRWLTYDVAS